MINGLCKNGMVSEGYELVLQMEENGCSPDSISFNIVVRAFLKENEINKAMDIFGEMRKRNLLPDEGVTSMMLHLALVDEQWRLTLLSLPKIYHS